MKRIQIIFLIMTISYYSLNGQSLGVYTSEVDSNIFVYINRNYLEIYQEYDNYGAEDIFVNYEFLKSKYEVVSDTILFTHNDKQCYFLVLSEDVIQIKDEINLNVDCNSKFYCTRKKDENGKILYFGQWKDGQKDGSWIYFNESGQRVIVTYNKGKEIEKTILKE